MRVDQSCSFTSPKRTAWGCVGDWTDPRDAGVAAPCCVQACGFRFISCRGEYNKIRKINQTRVLAGGYITEWCSLISHSSPSLFVMLNSL